MIHIRATEIYRPEIGLLADVATLVVPKTSWITVHQRILDLQSHYGHQQAHKGGGN
jgi:hypothetical protein